MVVDFGLGNLNSVARAVSYLGATPVISSDPRHLDDIGRAILPGVGAFGTAMDNLDRLGLIGPLQRFAAAGNPLLGICLGMQLFMEESDEGELRQGLGLIPGRVERLPESRSRNLKVPHVGWSGLEKADSEWSGSILDGLAFGDALYFVHSYHVVPENTANILAYTTYGDCRYCSVIAQGAVVGVQAHPEKSGNSGLRVLRNFLQFS